MNKDKLNVEMKKLGNNRAIFKYEDKNGHIIESFGYFQKKEDDKTIDEAINEKKEKFFKKSIRK